MRIHADGTAGVSARAVNARAYSVGTDIVFGAGEYAPHTSRGRELLAHEAAHVLQHRRGARPGLRRQALEERPAAADVAAATGGVVEAPERPPPEPPSFERLEREHPAVARAAGAVSRGFRALLASCRPVVERSGLFERKNEVVFWVTQAIPRALDYEQEIADKQLVDPAHVSTWIEHVRNALTRLAPLLDALEQTDQRRSRARLEAQRQRVVAQVEQFASSPYIRTGVEIRERERLSAAAKARIDAAVDYLYEVTAKYHDRRKSPDQLRIYGPVVASTLVHKMKLSGDEIRAALDALKAQDPEVLNAALFGGATVQSLLYMGIPGFQSYRARGEGFLSGFYRGSRESLLVAKPGQRVFGPLERVEASIWFVLGAFQGIGDALIDNVKSLIDMFTPKFWSELRKFFTEQLPEFIDNEETRFAAGMMMGQMNAEEERRMATAEPQEYGRSLGHLFGVAIVEIALMFIGLGWILKAVKGSERLMKALKPLFELAKYLGELAAVRKALRLVQVLSEGVGALSRRIRALLLRVPALTKGGKARRALSLAELAVEEAAADARKAEEAARRALALGDMAAAEKHMRDLETAAQKVQSKIDILESHGAGVYDEAAAAGAKTVERPPSREQLPPKREAPAGLREEPPRERVPEPDPEAKARTLEEVDAELTKRTKTPDGKHEVYVDPDEGPMRCTDCDLLSRLYPDELKDPAMRKRLTEIRAKARRAEETGSKKLAKEANDDAAKLQTDLQERWERNTLAEAEAQPGSTANIPPDEPPRVDPRARGAASEVDDLDALAKSRGTQKLPDWFKTLDGIEGEAKVVRRKGKTYLVFEDSHGVSLKSTQIVDPADLERKLRGDLADLLAFQDYKLGRVEVKNLKSRGFRLTFEEGTFKHVEQAGVQDLLKKFRANARKRGVTFEWDVYQFGKRVEGPEAMKAMKLLEYD